MKRQLSHPSFVEVKQEEKKTVAPKPLVELDEEDHLWIEILKTLDKLEKGVDGDLSALARATRNINKFRKRLPSTTWIRMLHSLIPSNYKKEFSDSLSLFIQDMGSEEVALISRLTGVELNESKNKLKANNGDVHKTILQIIDEKERLASIEIKKRQQQLKQERLDRENKKDGVDKKDKKSDDDKNNKMDIDSNKDGGDELEKKENNLMDIDEDNDEEKGDSKKEDSKKEDSKKDENAIKITLMPLKDSDKKRKFFPESYIFLQLLISLELYDRNLYKESIIILKKSITFNISSNRRTCDMLSSRLYQFYGLCQQRIGNFSSILLRREYFDYYQRACLQQNESAQSILIILILQSYINNKLYNLASSFVDKTSFPVHSESAYYARYHYYCGRIDCVELNYSDSLYHIQQSIRRAPQTGAYGFKLDATYWLITIQLLMGDIPDRNVFNPKFDGDNELVVPELVVALQPYYEITECVREGNLKIFQQVLKKYHKEFLKVGLSKILLRLRHNVIKTGLRKINKSYSRISLLDIANKLSLSDEKNAYFIVSKAIHDGVISAKIDYKNKCVESLENIDIYSTNDPYNNFTQRIKFCLDIRNTAIKSLRYPPKEDEQEEKKKKDDEEDLTAEEIAEMIQKHFEDQNDDE